MAREMIVHYSTPAEKVMTSSGRVIAVYVSRGPFLPRQLQSLLSSEEIAADREAALEWAWAVQGFRDMREELEARGRRPVTRADPRNSRGEFRACQSCAHKGELSNANIMGRCRRDGGPCWWHLTCDQWAEKQR